MTDKIRVDAPHSTMTVPRALHIRRERAGHAMLLFVLYFIVIIARGHGIVPVGLMLFFPEFPLPMITGWIGTGLLALALIPLNLQIYRMITAGGILLCYSSIILASLDSDAAPLTWILSAPLAAYAYRWWGKVKE